MQKVKEFEDEQLLYVLMQFTKYTEHIPMGMQHSRLGQFYPKLRNYDNLLNVDCNHILQT